MYGLKIFSPYITIFNMPLPNRQSIRLQNYDYSSPGYYFVTVCTRNMNFYFGKTVDGEMYLSGIGMITRQCWLEIPVHYPHVQLDKFVIMPNHIHGIIIINDVRAQNSEPLQNKYQYIIPRSLGCIIRGFKIGVTKWCRQNGHPEFQWKRNYHDHVIRNDKDLNRIRKYIRDNPLKWDIDKENPKN
jgi:REP element-mobilizing transposase RayT